MFRHLLLFTLLWGFSACTESFKHDETLAGRRAVEFAQLALVNQDVEKSYALLSDAAKRYVPLEKLKETLSRLHANVHPTRVTATEYEPMPGEKALYVYLIGQSSSGQLDYTVTMEGTATSDYKVAKIIRGHNAYLPATSGKKKFTAPISTQP